MSKSVVAVLCPLLFALFTAVSLFAQNQSNVERGLLWPLVGASVALAGAFVAIFLLATRNASKAGVLASLAVVAFSCYGIFFESLPTWSVVIWLGIVVAGSVAVFRSGRDFFPLTVALLVVALVMVAPSASSVVSYRGDHPTIATDDPRLWPTALESPSLADGARPPDIYILIPDDYARADVLAQYFDYDNSAFLHQLERRGFVVSDQARSPYAFSEMNIAALLNLDYLTNFPTVLGRTSQDFNVVKQVDENSRASRMLTAIGYDYVHLDTDDVTFSGGNPAISPFASPESFASLWLNKSILGQIGGPIGFNESAMNQRFRDSIHSEFSALGSIPTTGRPKFVVFHTLVPHDPFIFGAQGQAVTFPTDADHAGPEGFDYYTRQITYLNTLLLDAIDQIQARPGPPPAILIQADEGFEVDPSVFGEDASADIRVKGLSAFSLPGTGQPDVAMPPNTVNSLRYLFNQVLGTHYEMLDSVSHLEGDLPFDSAEIAVR